MYPAKGQSPQQQKSDEAACYSWAVQQSGFDPAKPQPQQQSDSTTDDCDGHDAWCRRSWGGARRELWARSLAVTRVTGAAVGAMAARGQSRRQNAAAAQQGQQQQQAANQQQQAAFGKARAACLEGRGYTVK